VSGWLGEIHPLVARSFGLADLARPPVAVELNAEQLFSGGVEAPAYEDISTYPAVFEDIAVVVDESVPARSVIDTVRAEGGPELRSVRIFDLYRGGQVGEGRKSLALRLEYRAPDRTLTDGEVARRRDAIRAALERDLRGKLRE
jgi:phenylalanyl-tRNA synthetase beta chain